MNGIAEHRAKLRADIIGQMRRAAAQAALTLVQSGFRNATAPDGTPWKPLALRKGRPLRDTGLLATSFTARETKTGISVGTNVRYADTHQTGKIIQAKKGKALRFKGSGGRKSFFIFARSVKIPSRPMVPAVDDLPESWRRVCDEAAEKVLRKALK